MELTTTIEDAPERIKSLGIPPKTLVHIVIEEQAKPPKNWRQELYEQAMNLEPIDIEGDIVETVKEERKKLDTRNIKSRRD